MSQSKLMVGVVGLAIFILAPIQLSSSQTMRNSMETNIETCTEEVNKSVINKIKLQEEGEEIEFISIQQEDSIEEVVVVEEEWINVNLHISFYTDLQAENTLGKETTDAQGNKLVYSTIAIPRDLPLGTTFIIDGFDGEFIGRDRGSKKYIRWIDDKTMKIDMYISKILGENNSAYHKRVYQMGVVKTTGKYLLPKEE